MKNLINFFISLAFVGYIKIIPGTFASLFSIFFLFPFFYYKIFNILLLLLIFIITNLISLYCIYQFSNQTKSHDSKKIVIDEFLGIYLIFFFYERIYLINNFFTCILIFILFRFFDISKLFPANIIDKKMLNPAGVILDDYIASIYTIITLLLINAFI